jgi:hypothetical protein
LYGKLQLKVEVVNSMIQEGKAEMKKGAIIYNTVAPYIDHHDDIDLALNKWQTVAKLLKKENLIDSTIKKSKKKNLRQCNQVGDAIISIANRAKKNQTVDISYVNNAKVAKNGANVALNDAIYAQAWLKMLKRSGIVNIESANNEKKKLLMKI